jgi:hypothetical protein
VTSHGAPPTLADVQAWPATVNVPKACKAIGVSPAHGYALAARGDFPAKIIKVGGSYRVVTASLVALLSSGGEAA